MRFELLYERWAPAVKAYILRRTDASAADDVLAEVFVVCWRRLEDVPEDALPWLLGVARRLLGTQRRAERRRAGLHDRLSEVPAEAPVLDAPALSDHPLAHALATLSESDRELLLLIAWEGLTPAQAAAVMGLKASTLRVRLLRARRRLHAALAEHGGAHAPCLQAPAEAS